jgi:hypothetical protein
VGSYVEGGPGWAVIPDDAGRSHGCGDPPN